MVQADSWLSLKINKKRDIFSHFYYNKCGVKHFLKLLFTWIESCFKQKLKARRKVSASIAAIIVTETKLDCVTCQSNSCYYFFIFCTYISS